MTSQATRNYQEDTSLPDDALTGDPQLDDFLIALDRRLAGRIAVRLQTIREIKDHLVEKKAQSFETGLPEAEASIIALQGIGTIDELVANQKALLRARFGRVALSTGAFFGILMGLFFGLQHLDKPLTMALAQGVFNGIFFGLIMGYVITYGIPFYKGNYRHYQPADSLDAFEVAQPTLLKVLSALFLSAFLAMSTCSVYVCFAYFGQPASETPLGMSWWLYAAILPFYVYDLWLMRLAGSALYVNVEGVLVKRWFRRSFFVKWDQIVAMEVIEKQNNWRVFVTRFKGTRIVRYRSKGGQIREFRVLRELKNADRFFLMIEEKMKERKGS